MPIDFKNFDLKSIDLKDKKTQTIILIVLVSFAAIAAYLVFLLFPQIAKCTMLLKKSYALKSELKSANITIAKMPILKKDLTRYKEKVERYEKKLPVEQEIQDLLQSLSSMAKASNIKIIGIVPALSAGKEDKSKGNQIYQEIPILITARSGYHELGNFLSDLENADRFMKVVDISIKSNKTSPKMHDVELMVCTYVLLPEK